MRRALLLLLVAWSTTAAPARADVAPAPIVTPPSDPLTNAPRSRHWRRMLLEAGLLFTGMEIQYWIDKEANRFDFAYDADAANLRARFITFEAWRLDDNFYETNAWRHTAQGGLNYLFARSNGFSAWQAYVVSLSLSAAWELVGEYKEEVSINDIVLTPRTGFVVGEAVWQLGVYLLRGAPTWFNEVVGNALTGGSGLMSRWDGTPRWRSPQVSRLGFDQSLVHRLDVYVAAGTQRASDRPDAQQLVRVGLATELIMIPGFDRPGRGHTRRVQPAYSQLQVEATWGDEAATDFRAFARTAVTTWHRKDLDAAGDGVNLLYGLSSAYEYGWHVSPGRTTHTGRDRLAIGHLIGPTVDVVVRRGRLRARATVDAYGDFALVHNFAIDAHRARFPDDEVRSSIVRDDYHHALGVTGRARLVASYGALTVGAAYQGDWFDSLEARDRHPEQLDGDDNLVDTRHQARAWTSYGLTLASGVTARLELAVEARVRAGQVKATRQAEDERRYLGGLRFEF